MIENDVQIRIFVAQTEEVPRSSSTSPRHSTCLLG